MTTGVPVDDVVGSGQRAYEEPGWYDTRRGHRPVGGLLLVVVPGHDAVSVTAPSRERAVELGASLAAASSRAIVMLVDVEAEAECDAQGSSASESGVTASQSDAGPA